MELEKLQKIIAEVLNVDTEEVEQIVSVGDAVEQIKRLIG